MAAAVKAFPVDIILKGVSAVKEGFCSVPPLATIDRGSRSPHETEIIPEKAGCFSTALK